MHLYLIRHGESDINLTWPVADGTPPEKIDTGLTERGRRQTAAMAAWLREKTPELAAIYASSMQRTLETAEMLAHVYGMTVRPDHRLREFGNNARDHAPLAPEELPGSLPGISTYAEPFTPYVDHVPHGEAFVHLRARVGAFLQTMLKKHSGQSIAVITHGATQAAFVDTIFNVPLYRRATLHSFYTCVSHFEYVNRPEHEVWQVHYLLATEHLALHDVK